MNLVGAAQTQGIPFTVATIFKKVLIDMAKSCSSPSMTLPPKQVAVKPFSLIPHAVDRECLLDEIVDNCIVSRGAVVDLYPCSAVQEGLLTLSIKHHGAYVAQPTFRLVTQKSD